MRVPNWVSVVSAFLVAALVFAAGLAVATWTARSDPPASLQSGGSVTELAVVERSIDDARTVEIEFATKDKSDLVSGLDGVLTDSNCVVGETVSSGQQLGSVDSQVLVVLSTSVPLWRDLEPGISGDEVLALQEELRRLGYDVYPDGEVGNVTLWAMMDLLGLPAAPGGEPVSIPYSQVVWIPEPSVTIASCGKAVGQTVTVGDVLASTSKLLDFVEVLDVPGGMIPGGRVLVVDGIEVPVQVSADGVVIDPAGVSKLAGAASFRALMSDSADLAQDAGMGTGEGVSGVLRLQDPVMAASVLPSAVYDIEGQVGCVVTDSGPQLVSIVGSELGSTFVIFEDGYFPQTVQVNGAAPSCR